MDNKSLGKDENIEQFKKSMKIIPYSFLTKLRNALEILRGCGTGL